MDVKQVIDDLEKQAAQYTEAANALRTLLPLEAPQIPNVAKRSAGRPPQNQSKNSGGGSSGSGSGNSTGKRGGQRKKKGPVSAETRARISAAIRAAHERRKAASAESSNA